MNRRHQITIFAFTVILAGFLFAPVSYAQTPVPNPAPATGSASSSSAPEVSLGFDDLQAAANSQAVCEGDFRKNVAEYGRQINANLTTLYVEGATYYVPEAPAAVIPATCAIVAVNKSVATDVTAADRLTQIIKSTQYSGAKISSSVASQTLLDYDKQQTSWWQRTLNFVLVAFYGTLASILGALASIAGALLTAVISNTTNAATPNIVGEGWLIIRDFMNLFFIFGLIVIGLGTILRIEAYNYKKLLVQLILMALLINFSKAIATSIISFFDVITNVVKGGNPNLFNFSAFMSVVTNNGGAIKGVLSGTVMGTAVTGFTSLIVAGLAIVAFIVLSAMFLLRLVGLWFLIMVSPVAYAMNILPQTKGYAQRWWSTFFKYLIWGPVALLFLRLANRLVEARASILITKESDMFAFAFVAVFLWVAISVVKQSGVYGSAAIMGVANKTISKAKGWNRAMYGAMGSYAARGTAAKHAGVVAGGLIGGQNTKWGKNLQKAGENTGKWIGTKTAQVQSAPQAFKEYFAIGDRARTKQINDEKLMTMAKAGTLDKKVYAELGPKHIKAMVDRGIKESEVSDILEHKGRVGADTLMLAFKNKGMLDKYARGEAADDEKSMIKSVTKSFLTNRGVKEFQYEQNQDKYEALVNKAEILGAGDKQKVHIVVPKQDDLNSLTVDQIKNMTPDQIMRGDYRVGESAERLAGEVEDAADTIRDAGGNVRAAGRARNNGNSGSPELDNAPRNTAPTPPVTPPPVQPTPTPEPPTNSRPNNNNGNSGSPELS